MNSTLKKGDVTDDGGVVVASISIPEDDRLKFVNRNISSRNAVLPIPLMIVSVGLGILAGSLLVCVLFGG